MKIITVLKDKSGDKMKRVNKLLKNERCMVAVFATWCGACLAMKSEWEKFILNVRKNHKKSNWNIITIYEPHNKKSMCMPVRDVMGYPSIFTVDKNNLGEKFMNERSSEAFLNFASMHLPSGQITKRIKSRRKVKGKKKKIKKKIQNKEKKKRQ